MIYRLIAFVRAFLGLRRGRLAVLIPPSVAEVERRLLAKLRQRARRDRLPIFLTTEDRMWHQGELCAGQYCHGWIYFVRIHEAYREDPWTLAHEMGHRACRQNGRPGHTEQDADEAATKLVKEVLIGYELNVVEKKMHNRLDGSGIVRVKERS